MCCDDDVDDGDQVACESQVVMLTMLKQMTDIGGGSVRRYGRWLVILSGHQRIGQCVQWTMQEESYNGKTRREGKKSITVYSPTPEAVSLKQAGRREVAVLVSLSSEKSCDHITSPFISSSAVEADCFKASTSTPSLETGIPDVAV